MTLGRPIATSLRKGHWSALPSTTLNESPSSRRHYAARPGFLQPKADTSVKPNASTRSPSLPGDTFAVNSNIFQGKDLVNRQVREMETKLAAKEKQYADEKRLDRERFNRELDVKSREYAENLLSKTERISQLEKSFAADQRAREELAKARRELKASQVKLQYEQGRLGEKEKMYEQAAKNRYQSRMAQLNTLEQAVREREKELLDAKRSYQDQQAEIRADSERRVQQHDQTLAQRRHEDLDKVNEHKQLLQKEAERVLRHAMTNAQQLALQREHDDRDSYASYHKLWEQMSSALRSAQSVLEAIQRQKQREAFAWDQASVQFINSRPLTFTKRYPHLTRSLERFYTVMKKREARSQDIAGSHVAAIAEARNQLDWYSHESRRLTTYHRFSAASNSYEKHLLSQQLLYSSPLQHRLGEIRSEKDSINSELLMLSSSATKESRRAKLRQLDHELEYLGKLVNFERASMELEATKAMRFDSLAEKDEFVLHQDMLTKYFEGRRSFGRIRAQVRRSTVSGFTGFEKEHIDELTQLRQEIRNAIVVARQKRAIEVHTGKSEMDATAINRRIEEMVEKAQIRSDRCFAQLLGVKSSEAHASTFGERRAQMWPNLLARSSLVKPVVATKASTSVAPASGMVLGAPSPRVVEDAHKLRKSDPDSSDLDRLIARKQRIVVARDPTLKRSDRQRKLLRKKLASRLAARVVKTSVLGKTSSFNLPADVEHSSRDVTGQSNHSRSQTVGPQVQPAELGVKVKQNPMQPEASPPQADAAPRSFRASRIRRYGSDSSAASKSGFSRPVVQRTATLPSNEEAQPSAVENAKPVLGRGVEPVGTLNIQPTTARMAVYTVRLPCEDAWQTTPASNEFSLAALTEDFRYRYPEASLGSHAAASGGNVNSQTSSGTLLETQSSQSPHIDSVDSLNMSGLALDDEYVHSRDLDELSWSSYHPSDDESNENPGLQSQDAVPDAEEAAAPSDQSRELSYHMSPEDHRNAMLASPNSGAAFWTYKLYKNAAGENPKIHYCTTYDQVEAQARHFLKQQVVGFDLEWEYGAWPGKRSIKDCVSLVQVASEDRIGLFQLALFKGTTADELMPPSLRAILESRDVTKVGVNIGGDAGRIEKCFDIKVQGCFELSHLHKVVKFSESSPHLVNRRLTKLADQVNEILGLPLKKDDVRTSAWSKKLRTDQTEYAASDAYAGFQLYHALEARRKSMNPMPPRPAFWEEGKPLQLGDGTEIVPRKKSVATGPAIAEEDDDDVYYDAVEATDPPSNSRQVAGVPLSGISVSYPTLPTADAAESRRGSANASKWKESTATPGPSLSTTKRGVPPPSDEVANAEQWATAWRASESSEYKPRIGQPVLRAYHLWHEQGFGCSEVAGLLRDPPLSVQTVASYVMQALQDGGLPYELARVRDVSEVLPRSVLGRYQRILARINAES